MEDSVRDYLVEDVLLCSEAAACRKSTCEGKEIEALTLIGYGNNIRTFLTTMEEKHNEINFLILGKEEFAAHRFNIIVFDELSKSSCKYFLNNVKQAKSDLIKDPDTSYCIQSMINLTNLYTNYTSTGHWTKYDEDREAKIIALATAHHNEQMKNENSSKKSTALGVQPVIDTWKFVYERKFNTGNGIKYAI